MNIYSLICLIRGHTPAYQGITWTDDGTEVAVYQCDRCRYVSTRLLPPEEVAATWEVTEHELPDGRDLEQWRRRP